LHENSGNFGTFWNLPKSPKYSEKGSQLLAISFFCNLLDNFYLYFDIKTSAMCGYDGLLASNAISTDQLISLTNELLTDYERLLAP
jgi:hypothetical protein